jgi:N-dimethylarginine dimethylaminohydrolase
VISAGEARELNAALRSPGLEVVELDLDMFTRGGGGTHCLGQALRRTREGAR